MKSLWDAQCLSRCMVYLSRFLVKMGEKESSLLSIAQGKYRFRWARECQQAFDQLKYYLSNAALLVRPLDGKTLFLYLAVTETVVSSVICSMRNEKLMSIYYVSHVLTGAKKWYSLLEKHIFNLDVSACKLKP